MQKYKVGSIVTGSITGIEKYGIFVSLDNYYNGLIHISEISDNFVSNINDYVKIGESIKCRVLEVDDNTCHLKLSVKGLLNKTIKRKKVKIVEVGSGFKILENNLSKWINDAKKI